MRNSVILLLGAGSLVLTSMVFNACGYPDYSGFDKPPGGDSSVGDTSQDPTADDAAATPDVTSEDQGAVDVWDAKPDADAAEASDAPDGQQADGDGAVQDDADGGPTGCKNNTECTDPLKPLCEVSTGKCGTCLPLDDKCPAATFCAPATLTCEPGCKSQSDCVPQVDAGTADGGTPGEGGVQDADTTDGSIQTDGGTVQCDLQTHQCIGCLLDSDCVLGTVCKASKCLPGCNQNHGCPSSQTCCSDKCADLSTDMANCGACGTVCAPVPHGTAGCSAGACGVGACDPGWGNCNSSTSDGCEADTVSSLTNCGACDAPCQPAHATGACLVGVCEIATCTQGWADCDLNAGNGCEVNTSSDLANCGACKLVCAALPHASTACVGSVCEVASCDTGYADCNGSSSDGCEKNVQTDTLNCGGCSVECNLTNANATCSAGKCVLASCKSGFADCDAVATNGCEKDILTDAENCGVCGTVCQFTNALAGCVNGACDIVSCLAGWGNCDGIKSNGCEMPTTQDVNHCGSCTTVCSVNHGTPTCNGTTCDVLSCVPNWGDCDGQYATGCEKPLNTLTDCGGCGQPCAPANATGSCSTGLCAITGCSSGYGDCDGNPANGCESNTNQDINNCGTCGNKCPTGCTPKCTMGTCGCSNCPAGSADCDNNPQNGCEINTTNDVNNCGGCGIKCSSSNGTPSCVNSTCQIVCAAGWGNCDNNAANGCETQLNTLANCGVCGKACNSDNGNAACTAGACKITCFNGWGDCDNNPDTGCEVNLGSNTSSCGACGRACAGAHASALACTLGVCTSSCQAGYGNCSQPAAPALDDGCESDLSTSTANCGACGRPCSGSNAASLSCAAGLCVSSCNAGFGNCTTPAAPLADNGCETALTVDAANCGGCGRVCSLVNVNAVACSAGVCSSSCSSGFGNCSKPVAPAADDGCETNVNTNVNNCGACARACSVANAQSTSCTAGSCNPTCVGGFGNCVQPASPTPDDGCESNLNTSTANCGSCGRACSSSYTSTLTCSGGTCSSACQSGHGNCSFPAAPTVDDGCESSFTSCAGSPCCGTLCQGVHDNGQGQTYNDCHALGTVGDPSTYTATMAQEAATAWNSGGTIAWAGCKTGSKTADCYYNKTATQCAVWCYTNNSGSVAGHTYLNATGSTCYCPTSTDATWN
ncbi:MAG: hypothetical protein HY898_16770 [Deltaproteobacteria bacterium]|nr:hypothetical protein [Deltaproteobacteria bacterium]